MEDTITKAVIYCRVSDPNQVKNGNGLSSQETRCREYARHRGYEVAAVFSEEGVTGAIIERPRMQEMLKFLRQHKKHETHVVIIDDISRLARDLKSHIELRSLISDAGGKLESPSLEFGEDSDSRLIEHMLATVAAHQREKNAEQVKNRMRARMQNGYWILKAPCGYTVGKTDRHRKVLVRNEPVATTVKEALEGYALGRFASVAEVQRFLEHSPNYPKNRNGTVYIQGVLDMLGRVLYTGYMEYPKWGIHLMPGHHEPIISMATYNRIQERLKGKAKAPIRKDIHLDFPLRGFVLCHCCQHPLTACWSQGRSSKYAYYICRNKECADEGKSVKREVMEEQFEGILLDLRPSPEIYHLTRKVIHGCWEQTIQERDSIISGIRGELHQIERRVEQFLERIVDADSAVVVKAYAAQIKKLETRKVELAEKIAGFDHEGDDFETSFQTAFEFLGNPHKLWSSQDIFDKRLTLKLAFAKPLPYHRKEGFQTAALSLPFAVTAGLKGGKLSLVGDRGLEPPTPTMSRWCSNQLS